jgi:hypothetical protein
MLLRALILRRINQMDRLSIDKSLRRRYRSAVDQINIRITTKCLNHPQPLSDSNQLFELVPCEDNRYYQLTFVTYSHRLSHMLPLQNIARAIELTCALMWIIAGKRNASVFPDPVAEIPIISLPNKAIGHPWL